MAQTTDPPKLKEGLWEIHGQTVENPGNKRTDFTYRLCRDHAYDDAANKKLREVEGCSTVLKDLGGGRIASTSSCQVAGVTIDSTGLMVYKDDASTHAESRATFTPAFQGKSDETITQDQKFIGKCPGDVKPGDRIAADGRIWHSNSP
jgi:ribosomal protein S11